MKYTNTYEELIEYLDAQMEAYLERKEMCEEKEQTIIGHYEEEKDVLKKQVNRFPETVRALWFLAFVGQLAKEKNVVVRNPVHQCPFMMYLLNLCSYDPFEEFVSGRQYLYPKSLITTNEHYVGNEFYAVLGKEIENYFEQTGHVVKWIGEAKDYDFFTDNREFAGMFVFSREEDTQISRKFFGELSNGTECILEEQIPEIEQLGDVFYFYPIEAERDTRKGDVEYAVRKYYHKVITKERLLQIMASSKADGMVQPYEMYGKRMRRFGDNIYSREDLYQYILNINCDEERAAYWTELIRKGRLSWMLEERKLSYEEYAELYDIMGNERIQMYADVKYLPSRWHVLEEFYWVAEQQEESKIIGVDFDGTLSLGNWPKIGPANEELIEFLKEKKLKGNKLILWTCREGDDLRDAVEWCRDQGLVFDAVNDNLPEMIRKYGANSRKISCDYYIDDRAVWTNAFELLR